MLVYRGGRWALMGECEDGVGVGVAAALGIPCLRPPSSPSNDASVLWAIPPLNLASSVGPDVDIASGWLDTSCCDESGLFNEASEERSLVSKSRL
jgi:hypothetical protein